MPWEYDTSLNAVANHEIGAVLFSKGGLSDGTKDWEVRWNKEVFSFKTSDITEWLEKDDQKIKMRFWHIESMKISEHLQEKRDLLLGMATDAMKEYGKQGRIKVINEVTISEIFMNDEGLHHV